MSTTPNPQRTAMPDPPRPLSGRVGADARLAPANLAACRQEINQLLGSYPPGAPLTETQTANLAAWAFVHPNVTIVTDRHGRPVALRHRR